MCEISFSDCFAHLTGIHLIIEPFVKALFRYTDISTNADAMKYARFHKTICGVSTNAQNILYFIHGVNSLFIGYARYSFRFLNLM